MTDDTPREPLHAVVDVPAPVGLPGSQDFEDAILAGRYVAQKKALAAAYIDLAVRCREDGKSGRDSELRTLRALERLVFGANTNAKLRPVYDKELRDIQKSVLARRNARFAAKGGG